jgi:uncharacterized protein (TIGR03382 family)
MTKVFGILAVAGLAAGAQAQGTRIDLLVSSDGGATWSNNVDVLPGTVVKAAIFVSTDAYGFAGASITALTATGGIGDTAAFAAGSATGRVAPFNFGAATNAIFAIAGGFRIDAASDPGNSNTAAGFLFAQRDPASAGGSYVDASQTRLAFAFDVSVSGDNTLRVINMAFGPLVRGVATVHTSAGATRGTQVQATLDGATITVVPTPATLALVGLGGLVAGRRRR